MRNRNSPPASVLRMLAAFAFAAALLAAGAAGAQPLRQIEGAVEIRSAETEPWRPASDGEVLAAGGALRTFGGQVEVAVEGGRLLLGPRSELTRIARRYRLDLGRAHVVADDVEFALDGQVRVRGEARLDNDPALGRRVGVLAGSARATVTGRVIEVLPGQQVLVGPGGSPRVAPFVERDPWYLGQIATAIGGGEVIGAEGVAELLAPGAADDAWSTAGPSDRLEPGGRARTGADAWLELRLVSLATDGRGGAGRAALLRVLAHSEIELLLDARFGDSPGERRTVVRLLRGTAWAVVEGDGQRFEIDTPGLVAAVRGTTFRVDAASADDAAEVPRLKTFDGTVVGVFGFEAVEVGAGLQFTPATGVAPLELDALDAFNLARDLLLRRPELELDLPPGQTSAASAAVVLRSDDPARLTLHNTATGIRLTATDALELTADLTLARGFNLIEARGSFGGAATLRAAPLVSSGGVPFGTLVALPRADGDALLRWRGATAAGSVVEVRSDADERVLQRLVVGADGRFVLALPAATRRDALRVAIGGPAGSRTLPLPEPTGDAGRSE